MLKALKTKVDNFSVVGTFVLANNKKEIKPRWLSPVHWRNKFISQGFGDLIFL